MTVGELQKMLEGYPDDMEIVNRRCSDWSVIDESEWSIIQGVEKGYYVMTAHRTMSDEEKAEMNDYLALEGN